MQKKYFLIIMFCVFLLSACQNKNKIYDLSLENDKIDIYVGETISPKYIASVNGKRADLDIELISSSENIDISKTNITALDIGHAIVMIRLKDDADKVVNLELTILNPLEITNDETTIYVGEELIINVIDKRTNPKLTNLEWSSSNTHVATISNGTLLALTTGSTTITVINSEGLSASINMEIKTPTLEEISFMGDSPVLNLNDEYQLSLSITPPHADNKVKWSSSDSSIVSVNANGLIKALMPGIVTITATSIINPQIKATIEVSVEFNALGLFASLNVENPLNQIVTSYGASDRTQTVYGSVSHYFFSDLNLIEDIAPITQTGGSGANNTYVGLTATEALLSEVEPKNFTRSGILKPDTTFITYHDTGNNSPGADALMHSSYLKGTDNLNNRARSWHYTVDDIRVVHHIPDNEVTWQGDSYTSYAYSIGIETGVHYGSDLYTTWHRTGKLMASLLLKYNLDLSQIKQHNDWNGKECPQTLRRNGLYPLALEMIRAEYLVAKYLSDYEISFTSLNPDLVDARGRVIKLPSTATRVGYIVRIQKDDYDESIVLYSIIPGNDGTTNIENINNVDLEIAQDFDLKVAKLNPHVTKDDYNKINALVSEYNSFSTNQQMLVTTKELLDERVLSLHRLDALNTEIIISQFMTNNNDSFAQGYIELFNPTNSDISLAGYSLQYHHNSSQIYVFNTNAIIKAKSYFLVATKETNTSSMYLPLPDALSNINLDSNGYLVLAKGTSTITSMSNDVIDLVGFNNSSLFEANKLNFTDQNLAYQRFGLIDTNNNELDFIAKKAHPHNSLGETLSQKFSTAEADARVIDLLILSLEENLSLNDQKLLTSIRDEFNTLSSEAQSFVRLLEILIAKEDEMEGLVDPNFIPINQAIRMVPKQIINDFTFPTNNGVAWSYKEGEDNSYFNLSTGKYLKISYEPKLITLVVSKGGSSKEVIINFGVLNPGVIGLFYTGTSLPSAGGLTGEGKGTPSEQEAKVGFSGIALIVDGKALFVAEKSYIPLVKPSSGNLVTKEMLRPYGSSSDTAVPYNQSLVKGVPTAYAGAGSLYENTSDITLEFDPSNTYGRNNSGAYGYAKVVFTPIGEGMYEILEAWPNSGSNDTTDKKTQTLKPGELLWCPHTYETNANYGTWFMQPGTSTNGTPVLDIGKTLQLLAFKTKFN